MPEASGAGLQGSTRWAVIKYKFSDRFLDEPPLDPYFIFGSEGMAGYWNDLSFGQINLDGSAILGWFTLPFTLAEGSQMNRGQLLSWCIVVAQQNNVDLSGYDHLMAILNVNLASGNSGALGIHVLLEPWALVDAGFAEHEMGHAYGLNHSYDDAGQDYGCPSNCYGDPGVYGDSWDIMSYATFGQRADPTFPSTYGKSGPGLIAPNMEKLGWIPADRIATGYGAFTLAALNRPLAGGSLMVKVPFDVGHTGHYYTVEFRRKADWDRGIPQDTVLIHEVRTNGLYYLVTGDGGPQRLQGSTFHGNNVVIKVLSMNAASDTATIEVGTSEAWVNFAYPGAPLFIESGDYLTPYNTLMEGVAAISPGGILHINAGTSSETGRVTKAVTLEAYGGPVTIGH